MAKTVSEIHAEIDAAKKLAMENFERTYGTRDVKAVAVGLVNNTAAGRIKWTETGGR